MATTILGETYLGEELVSSLYSSGDVTLYLWPMRCLKTVVAALKEFGITKSAAYQIAEPYSIEYIFDKIAQTRWLLENQPAAVRKNVVGYLRKAV